MVGDLRAELRLKQIWGLAEQAEYLLRQQLMSDHPAGEAGGGSASCPACQARIPHMNQVKVT
jgi:hypothetical protein